MATGIPSEERIDPLPAPSSEEPATGFDRHLSADPDVRKERHAMEIQGCCATAVVYAKSLEQEALLQIKALCDDEVHLHQKIRIMPDVHAGKNCLVGFTATIDDRVNPYEIGVDIGCGVLAAKIGRRRLDCDKLDRFIRRKVPSGTSRHAEIDPGMDPELSARVAEVCRRVGADTGDCLRAFGTLGGGNHFIEVDRSESGDLWLCIHSGSRTFGKAVAEHHQARATTHARIHRDGRGSPWLDGARLSEYLADLEVAQAFARGNRLRMAERIFAHLGASLQTTIETSHNYMDTESRILRKGAVAAPAGTRIAIPLNMRDGVVLATGLGNEEWNVSAPHGAGRRMSRRKARESIDLDKFRHSMRGIWSSCVGERTLDESPQAYKPAKEILDLLGATATVEEILRPVYNFKAA
ncbi:MAG TPA: RtcB family protein [Fibrobacteria bacterium]|nr:RtcB family protein [Fibrobacteria bacterium]HOX50607.1 RtcB family protein [Fibrobacteria bacterium]